eukprot:m.66755 g.66755  ORF g.66755 m.66755 type:complete len:322 (-) comp18125_c0_seq3:70-1035(-)
MRLIEETHVHVLLLGLLLLFHLGCRGWLIATAATPSRGRRNECARVGKVRLDGLGLLEGDVSGDSDRQDVLEGVEDHVRRRGSVRDAEGERERGHTGEHRVQDPATDRLHGDVEDLWRVHGPVVKNHDDGTVVPERRDAQHVQQLGLGKSDLGSHVDHSDIGKDLDGTLGDLGREVEGLEERRLLRTHTGRTSRDDDIERRDDARLGRRLHLVLVEHLTDSDNIHVGEAEADVTDHRRQQLEELRLVLGLGHLTKALADHGVLAHEQLGAATERSTHSLHLPRLDVVNTDHDDLAELVDIPTKLVEVVGLPLFLVELDHFV